MAVTIQIDVERLNEPTVAKALASLILALGGAETASEKPAAPAPAPKAQPAPKPAAPAPAPTPVAAAPAPAPKKAAKSAAKSNVVEGSLADRYRAFVGKLPPRSRAFLDLVRERGTINIEDAMKALDVSVSKAMGGITGSIGRWAPVRGVPVPYEASMVDGLRTWTWIGSPIDDEAAPAPAAPKPKARKTRKASAKKTTTRKATGKKAKTTAPAAGDDLAARYQAFVSNLPERSQKFLALVRERKVLTIGEAMKALDIEVPKAMGGITGSIGRWAPVRGIPVPYKARTIEGERAWEWLGAPGEEGASPKAEAPEGVNSPKGANTVEETREAERKAAIDAIIETLPPRSSLFVRTLRQRGELTMPDVLQQFSLAKARAVAGIVDPINAAFEAAGLEMPFIATFAATGDKAWIWPQPGGSAKVDGESGSEPAAPAVDAERGVSTARPGVRVRRRAR